MQSLNLGKENLKGFLVLFDRNSVIRCDIMPRALLMMLNVVLILLPCFKTSCKSFLPVLRR